MHREVIFAAALFAKVAAGLLLSAVPATVAAGAQQVYRCTGENGETEFRQTACDHGGGEQFLVRDQRVGWRPRGNGPARQSATPSPTSGSTPAETDTRESREPEKCWRARQRLDAIAWKLRRGYKGKEGVRLHRRQRETQSYLHQFCLQ